MTPSIYDAIALSIQLLGMCSFSTVMASELEKIKKT